MQPTTDNAALSKVYSPSGQMFETRPHHVPRLIEAGWSTRAPTAESHIAEAVKVFPNVE